jgi:hypothetical protein
MNWKKIALLAGLALAVLVASGYWFVVPGMFGVWW